MTFCIYRLDFWILVPALLGINFVQSFLDDGGTLLVSVPHVPILRVCRNGTSDLIPKPRLFILKGSTADVSEVFHLIYFVLIIPKFVAVLL